jgi:hypothetical protein
VKIANLIKENKKYSRINYELKKKIQEKINNMKNFNTMFEC